MQGERWGEMRQELDAIHEQTMHTMTGMHDAHLKQGPHWLAALVATTDLKMNAGDPMGNGDQSLLLDGLDINCPAQLLRNAWSDGCDFNPPHNGQSHFCRACFCGNLAVVQEAIAAATALGPEVLHMLLETRESYLRMSPLLSTIAGSRMTKGGESKDSPMYRASKSGACYRSLKERDEYESIMGDQHGEVVDELLRAGCRVDCCDVAGYSPMHHCCTGIASASSLRIALKLAGKADPNVHNRCGMRPLHEPTMARRLDVVIVLLECGADPMLNTVRPPKARVPAMLAECTPLALAKMYPDADDAMRAAMGRKAAIDSQSLVGRRVSLIGLKDKSLNGASGLIAALDVVSGRYEVTLDSPDSEEESSATGGRQLKVQGWKLRPETLEGRRVTLQHLSDETLNGRLGTCGPFQVDTGRYAVTLDAEGEDATARTIAVRPANLAKAHKEGRTIVVCSLCGVEATKLQRCMGCLSVGYCSSDCQTAAWAEHKPACKRTKKGLAVFDLPEKSRGLKSRVVSLKVQIALAGPSFSSHKPAPVEEGSITIYDEQRSFRLDIQATDPHFGLQTYPQYGQLDACVREHGVRLQADGTGVKAYFVGAIIEGKLKLDVKNPMPPQLW